MSSYVANLIQIGLAAYSGHYDAGHPTSFSINFLFGIIGIVTQYFITKKYDMSPFGVMVDQTETA